MSLRWLHDVFTFPDRCCDADQYLQMGKACAESGLCFDSLRPVGAVYWFSLPYRLGLPAEILIGLHLALVALSVWLSVLAMRRWLVPSHTGRMFTVVVALVSLAAHLVFCWPVLRLPLSDLPANLGLLLGVWLLLLVTPGHRHALRFTVLAGLCLGLAVIMRTFFLVPVLAVLYLVVMMCVWRPSRIYLGVLAALLPISAQYVNTWKHEQAVDFLAPKLRNHWTEFHLHSDAIGYDILLPANGYYWHSPCVHSVMVDALLQHDIHSLACLFAGRLDYYLGSYLSSNYTWGRGDVQNWGLSVLPSWRDSHDTPGIWSLHNLTRHDAAVVASDGTLTASLLQKPDPHKPGELAVRVHLDATEFRYQFSAWLWSASGSHTVLMQIRRHDSGEVIAEKQVALTPEKKVQTLDNVVITTAGDYDAVLELPQGDAVCIWGDFDLRWYMPPLDRPDFRTWSPWILAANLSALLLSALLFWRRVAQTGFLPMLAPVLLVLCFAEALVIIPEQRFVIAPMIAIWVFAAACVAAGYEDRDEIAGQELRRVVRPRS